MTYNHCSVRHCSGARLGKRRCIQHITPRELRAAIKRWRLGAPLDAHHAKISSGCIQSLLRALIQDESETHPSPLEPNRRATFHGIARFEEATFTDFVDFTGATFIKPAHFDGAKFQGGVTFNEATFHDHADFDNVTFNGPALFGRATFKDHAGFQDTQFLHIAKFTRATLENYVDFENAQFSEDVLFTETTFQLAHQLGPLFVDGHLALDASVFSERLTIEADAQTVSAKASIFGDGVRLSLKRAAITLDEADFGRASTLSHASHLSSPPESLSPADDEELPDPRPGLISLHGAQIAALSLSDIHLCACRFFGAHGLESLNIEPSCCWLHTPSDHRCIDRELIAEEHHWRCADEQQHPNKWTRCLRISPRWREHADNPHGWADGREHEKPLYPKELAALYRALRKAREDSKDQAGAGDLYYGEMEMRRLTKTPLKRERGRARAICDKWVIRAYWLLSGYGLKASRAFTAWLFVIALASLLLAAWGFTQAPLHQPFSFLQVLLFSVESTSSLTRVVHPPAHHDLKVAGEAIQVSLRLIGPLLIGLFLLALRARVKR